MTDVQTQWQTRNCGECTACCEGWLESARMRMRPGCACRHLAEGRCSIYAERPENPCRNFDCGWKLQGSPLPDDMRPDQCGAIVILDQDFRRWATIRAVPVGWQIPDQTLRRIKSFAVAQKVALIYHEHEQDGDKRTLTHQVAFGPPDFMAAFREAMQQSGAEELDPLM